MQAYLDDEGHTLWVLPEAIAELEAKEKERAEAEACEAGAEAPEAGAEPPEAGAEPPEAGAEAEAPKPASDDVVDSLLKDVVAGGFGSSRPTSGRSQAAEVSGGGGHASAGAGRPAVESLTRLGSLRGSRPPSATPRVRARAPPACAGRKGGGWGWQLCGA